MESRRPPHPPHWCEQRRLSDETVSRCDADHFLKTVLVGVNMAATPAQGPRPWDPDFKHSDRERWICAYPANINRKKTIAQGRLIPITKAVDNPTYTEMRDVCAHAGMTIGVENKVYPRERDYRDVNFRGRIRVQLKTDDAAPVLEQFPSRQSILLYMGETIPKLKHRQGAQSQAAASGSSQGQASTGSAGAKKKKGKRK